MHREGHYGMALLVYTPVGGVLLALGLRQLAVVGGAVVVGGAMVPDLDQRVPGIRHRGPTHTVWFALAVGALLGVLGWLVGGLPFLLLGVGSGVLLVLAHLAADVLTPAGIQPLAPVDDTRYTLDLARAANPLANYGLLALGLVVAGGTFVLASG